MEQEVKKDLENVQETSEPANSKTVAPAYSRSGGVLVYRVSTLSQWQVHKNMQ